MSKRKQPRSDRKPADHIFDSLNQIAANLWWSWHPRARALFERIDAKSFHRCDQNPIIVLDKLTAGRRRTLQADTDFAAEVRSVFDEMRRDLRRKSWYAGKYGRSVRGVTAYFCMEYAVHESLPLYAGGLGVLAGDHLKSASDLGLPLVAIGIYWKNGYTRQRIDSKGQQRDAFPELKPKNTPFTEVSTKSNRPLRLRIPMAGRNLVVRAWQLDVGRVPLYLLDTDLPDNSPADRKLTHVLYSGDRDTRIRQEILLGIGGWRLLRALQTRVTCCHLNEGHAAFLSLERIAERMNDKRESFKQALRYVRNTSVFTTHTPIPAGNEEFDPELVDRYFSQYRRRLKLSHDAFHDLARVRSDSTEENFGMTPLALRTSRYANGVAALHGRIARRMWKGLFPGRNLADVPIGHVTNGIHLRTWLHPVMGRQYDDLLGRGWEDRQDQVKIWSRISRFPDAQLWAIHQGLKKDLVAFCRDRLKRQLQRSHVAGMKVSDVDRILNPDKLTIGFARRFAPYKRATLLFTDPDRLARMVNAKGREVQFIFSGKAHPADADGKALIQRLIKFARMPRFRRRIVFLEDYEMEVARHMVAGVDVWLNNPERPREASGTSGMKPALHGGLNLSILDGWWPEGFNRKNGWAIGTGKNHDGSKAADDRDADDLYRKLEKELVPLFYHRDETGLPVKWIARMKNAMATIAPVFNSHRQVKQYLTRYYLPAMRKA